MNNVMSPEEFERLMKEISDGTFYSGRSYGYDREDQHFDADRVIMNLLRQLGYEKGVDIFDDMPKWYA